MICDDRDLLYEKAYKNLDSRLAVAAAALGLACEELARTPARVRYRRLDRL